MSVAISSTLRWAAAVVAVFAFAFLAAAALHQTAQRLGWLPWASAADSAASAPATGVPDWSAWGATFPVATVPPVVEPVAAPLPAWHASLLVGGRRHAIDGASIALPTGTRFQVALHGLPPGTVSLHAINPHGEASVRPLWTTRVRAGAEAVSPTLRLQGTRGVETLRVVHRDAQGVVREGTVRLWHL